MQWDYKQFNNYKSSIIKRSTGEKFNIHRFSSSNYSRIIITKETIGELQGNIVDKLTVDDIDAIDLNMVDNNDVNLEGIDINDLGLDLDLDNLDNLDDELGDIDGLEGLELDFHMDPNEAPTGDGIVEELSPESNILDWDKSRSANENGMTELGKHILDLESPLPREDRIEDSFMELEDPDMIGGGSLVESLSEYGDTKVEYIGQGQTEREVRYMGFPVAYDQLTTNHKEDKYTVTVKYDYGDLALSNRLVNLCNKVVQIKPKKESDVKTSFVWEETSEFSKTLGTTQERKYSVDNIDMTELINVHGSILGKSYEDDDYIIDIEFKRLTDFQMRDKPLPRLAYRKTTTSKLKVDKKYIGEEHKILQFPPIEYFKSFLNIGYMDKCDYRIIDNEADLKAVAKLLESADLDHVLGYDAETTGLNFYRRISPEKKDVLVSHSLSWQDNQSVIFPIRMRNRKNISTEMFNYYMKDILEKRRILAHHGIADVRFLIEEGIELNLMEDTYHLVKHIMPYLRVDEITGKSQSRSRITRSLEALVNRAFGIDLIDLNKYIFKPAGVSFDFSKLNDEYLIHYGCPDTDTMRRLWKLLRPKLEPEQELAYRATVRFSKVLAEKTTYEGIRLSEDIVVGGRKRAKDTVDYLEDLALELAGETKDTLNIGSSKQVANYIYGKLGVEVNEKTKRTNSGELAADKYVLESLSKIRSPQPTNLFKEDILSAEGDVILEKDELNNLQYPFCAVVRKYADVKKDLTAYYDGLLQKSIDGLYHPEPRVGSTATWRTTERTQITKSSIKYGLTAYDDEHYFVALDFSAEELRLAVNQSEDYGFMDILDDPENDAHTSAAATLWGLKTYAVSSALRAKAKACNFGIIYGMGPSRLTKNLNGTEYPTQEQLADGKKLYNQYNYTYSRMISALKPAIEKVQKDGYLYNNLMYKMIYDDVLDLDDFEEQVFSPTRMEPPVVRLDPIRMKEYGGSIKNKSGNYPIQSWAAGMLMILVVALEEELKRNGIYDKVSIPLLVHDEVDLIVHESVDPHLILKILVKVFQVDMNYLNKRTVPLYVGIGFGHSWGEAKEDKREIPVNLQKRLIEEYDRGLTPKNLIAKEIPKYFKDTIDNYIRQRLRDVFPDILESKTYLTGRAIDILRHNIYLLKKGGELFGFYHGKTDTYYHEKILEELCKGTELNPIDFTIIHTEPTEDQEVPEEERVVDFYFNPMIHERVIVLGNDMIVDCTGVKQAVVKNLLTYLIQFNDLEHDKSKRLVLKIGETMKPVQGVKLLGLPMVAKDELTNIFNGGQPTLIGQRRVLENPEISIADVFIKDIDKVTLDLTHFKQEEQGDRLKKLLEFLTPWMVGSNSIIGRNLEIYNGETTRTNFKVKDIPMKDMSKLFDIIQ